MWMDWMRWMRGATTTMSRRRGVMIMIMWKITQSLRTTTMVRRIWIPGSVWCEQWHYSEGTLRPGRFVGFYESVRAALWFQKNRHYHFPREQKWQRKERSLFFFF
ncbi:hypothetical protein L209DRAFT_144234 [Thermothelomyces heterothallicus CBS 203.75]